MVDLKFETCRTFSGAYQTIAQNLETEEFRSIARTFSASVDKIDALASLPAETAYWFSVFGAHKGAALERIVGLGNGPENEQTQELAQKLFDEWRRARPSQDPEFIANQVWREGAANFSSLMRQDDTGDLVRGAEATLATMVTGSWAAFETLTIDLWKSAVNLHHTTLAANVARKFEDKAINFSTLADARFDLRNAMGDIFVRLNKIKTSEFSGVKDAYKIAFASEWNELFDRHPNLGPAEVVRHLFAHRSGYVDQRFIDRSKNMPFLSTAELGRPLVITGEFASKCVDACVRCGVELLSFVDKWSVANRASRVVGDYTNSGEC